MQQLLVGAFCFAFLGAGQIRAEVVNGAVPGLMPPLMELQVATRLEAKTLRQLGQILEEEAPQAFQRGAKDLKGAAEGLKLTLGMSVDRSSWRFGGLGRETTPIWLHLSKLMESLSKEKSVTEAQLKGLRDWYGTVDQANRDLMSEASLANLKALSEALEAVEVPLKAFDAPETVFLEVSLNASKLQRRSFDAIDFFARVQHQLKTGLKEKPPGNPTFENITMDAEAAVKTPNGEVFRGMDDAFKAEIEKIASQLETFSKSKTAILAGDMVWFRDSASRGRAIAGELKSGKFAALAAVVEWSNEVYATSFNEPSLAPALLIHSQMMLMGAEVGLLKRIGKGLEVARQQGASGLTLQRDGMKIVVKGVDQKLTFDFVESGSLNDQIEVTLRLAKATLGNSRLDKVNREKLEAVIVSLENQLVGLTRPSLGTDWADWVTELAKLIELYNF